MAFAGAHEERGPSAPPQNLDSMENDESSASFRAFWTLQDQTFATVQEGLHADEEGDAAVAQQAYIRSLPLLDRVLTTNADLWSDASSAEINATHLIQLKMNKTKLQVTYRLENLEAGDQTFSAPENTFFREDDDGVVNLPSYDEAVTSSPSSPTTEERADVDTLTSECCTREGMELFRIDDGVQLFHITQDGNVSPPSYPSSLHIVQFETEEPSEDDGNSACRGQSPAPHSFLQVGDWVYPLIPDASPMLHTTFGAYLFPDLSPEGTGSSVGVILPATLSQGDCHLLDDVLQHFCFVREQQRDTLSAEVPSAPMPEVKDSARVEMGDGEEKTERLSVAQDSTSAKISRGILVATSWISWGLGKGAEKAGQCVSYGSSKLREALNPEATPRRVDPHVQKGVLYARKASSAAVAVSCYIVTKLGDATVALGRQVAPHIRKKGEELLPSSVKTDENKSRLQGVMEVAASGLQGLGTVWVSLESAAKALGTSVATETVATVHYKYGEDAAKLAENTVYTAGNVALTAYTAESLAMKAIAKRTARDAGAAVVHDLHPDTSENQNQADGHMTETDEERKDKDTEHATKDASAAVVHDLHSDTNGNHVVADAPLTENDAERKAEDTKCTAIEAGAAMGHDLHSDTNENYAMANGHVAENDTDNKQDQDSGESRFVVGGHVMENDEENKDQVKESKDEVKENKDEDKKQDQDTSKSLATV